MRTFADRAPTPKPPNTPKPQLRPTEHQAMWPDESASSLPRRQVELQESAKDRTFYMQKVEQVRSHCLSMRFSLPLIAFSLPFLALSPPFHAFFHCLSLHSHRVSGSVSTAGQAAAVADRAAQRQGAGAGQGVHARHPKRGTCRGSEGGGLDGRPNDRYRIGFGTCTAKYPKYCRKFVYCVSNCV